MTESAYKLSKKLAAESLRIRTFTALVRLNDDVDETEQAYLHIHGTPDAYRWLAKLLTERADIADSSPFDQVIVSGADLRQLVLDGWNSIHLECEQTLHNSNPNSEDVG